MPSRFSRLSNKRQLLLDPTRQRRSRSRARAFVLRGSAGRDRADHLYLTFYAFYRCDVRFVCQTAHKSATRLAVLVVTTSRIIRDVSRHRIENLPVGSELSASTLQRTTSWFCCCCSSEYMCKLCDIYSLLKRMLNFVNYIATIFKVPIWFRIFILYIF